MLSVVDESDIAKVHQCLLSLSDRTTKAEAQSHLATQLLKRLQSRSIQMEVIAMLVGAENARYEGFLANYLQPLVAAQHALMVVQGQESSDEFAKYRAYARQCELKIRRENEALRAENEALKAAMETTVHGRRILSDVMEKLAGAGSRNTAASSGRDVEGNGTSSYRHALLSIHASSNTHRSTTPTANHQFEKGKWRAAVDTAATSSGSSRQNHFSTPTYSSASRAVSPPNNSLTGVGPNIRGISPIRPSSTLFAGPSRLRGASPPSSFVDGAGDEGIEGGVAHLEGSTSKEKGGHHHRSTLDRSTNHQEAQALAQLLARQNNRIAQVQQKDNAQLLIDVTASMLLR